MTIGIPLWILFGIAGIAALIIIAAGLFSFYLCIRYIFIGK